MFALEPLALFQGIPDIEMRGVPSWFQNCLEMRIRGEGGELRTIDWPTKVVKRKLKGSKKKVKVEVSTRECWQPVFDWNEFMKCNGLLQPSHMNRFFPAPQDLA